MFVASLQVARRLVMHLHHEVRDHLADIVHYVYLPRLVSFVPNLDKPFKVMSARR